MGGLTGPLSGGPVHPPGREEVAVDGEAVQIMNLVPLIDLTPAREEWLVNGLVQALPSLKMRELFSLRRDMFTEAGLVTVAVSEATGAVVGALSSRWVTLRPGVRFLHVTTQFVGDGYRHGMVFRQSWATHLAAVSAGPWGFPATIVLKTYNPRVFCAMRSFTQIPGVSFYPDLEGTPDADTAWLAGQIARTIASEYPFDPVTGVVSGAGVPADLYPSIPKSTDTAVNRFFAETTRPGDRVLCMLMVPTPQAARAIMVYFASPRRSQTAEAPSAAGVRLGRVD
jgi:hypothetical protein